MRFLFQFLLLFCLLNFSKAQLPDDFSDQKVSEDWDLPMGLTFDEAGRMFVWEKAGRVYVVDTNGVKNNQPLIDIREEVGYWRDHGLLGFALDPNFLNNGHFYLLYAVERYHLLYFGTPQYQPGTSISNEASIGRVTRFTADHNDDFLSTIQGSRKVLIGEDISSGIPLYHESHGVGTILFGEDGTLLISCGDGNSNAGIDIGGDEFGSYATQALADGIISEDQDVGSFKAQYLGSLNGKILRIDPDTGDGVSSNPFFDPNAPRSAQSRTWVYGFRNPFRMVLVENTGSHNPNDADPGTLIIGDVGASSWEELNIAERGGLNFGWPLKEGLSPFWGFWNADHPENKLSPNPLFNGNSCLKEYFDFKDLFAEAREDGQVLLPNPCDPAQPIPESAFPNMETPPTIVWSHNEWNLPTKTRVGIFDEDGKLKAVEVNASESPVEADLFDGNSSIAGTFYNGENFPEYYKEKYFHADYSGWIKLFHFDENNKLTKVEPFHDAAGKVIQIVEHPIDGCLYYLSFINNGSIHKICYGGNPPPIAIAKSDTIYGPSPLFVNFDASESYDPFGLPISYFWDFNDGSNSQSVSPVHEFETNDSEPKSFSVLLTVTDSLGASSKDEIVISLNNTPPQVEIVNPKDSSFYSIKGNNIITLDAVVSDLEHSDEELQFEWQTFLHHNSHFHPEEPMQERNPKALISPVGCEADADYWFRIKLIVTDGAGLKTIKESEIFPYCGPEFFELIDLDAQVTKQYVEIQWDIIFEDNVHHYEIQRSPFFQSIGEIASTGIGAYTFVDNYPLFGENIYRIKAVREDQIYDYSNTVKAIFPPKADFNIYPNPSNDIFHIEIKKANSDRIQFELFDASGKKVVETLWNAIPGSSFKRSILTYKLSNGIYFFRMKDGEIIERGRIAIAN